MASHGLTFMTYVHGCFLITPAFQPIKWRVSALECFHHWNFIKIEEQVVVLTFVMASAWQTKYEI